MKLSLVMVTAEGTAREFPVPSLPVVLGRGDEAKIRIPLASVSRRHCELLDDDDELVVRDLGSSNGTYVNAERIKKRELIPGDLLSLGPVVFVVRIDGYPKDINAADSYLTGAAGHVASEGAKSAISGVPTWSGAATAGPTTQPSPPKPSPSKPTGPEVRTPEKAPNLKPKGGGDGLLGDLSESDFDIDFSDLEDPPKK